MIFFGNISRKLKSVMWTFLSGLSSAGESSINNDISALSLVTIIPDVIIPIAIPWLIMKREGKKYPSIYDNKKKGNYFIDYQFKDGRLDSFTLNRAYYSGKYWQCVVTMSCFLKIQLEFCSIHSISEENWKRHNHCSSQWQLSMRLEMYSLWKYWVTKPSNCIPKVY